MVLTGSSVLVDSGQCKPDTMSNNNILWKGLVVLGTFMLLGFFVSYHLLLLSRDGPGENNVELFGQSGSQIQKRAIVRRNHRPDHITTTSSSSASSSLSSTTEATSTTITPSKPSTSSPETGEISSFFAQYNAATNIKLHPEDY